ncbi:MAG: gamma-glutamyl-gamma-aminobutyrate hydrolase family protein, partial [Acidobacteriota bacterium]|nr:gamma-glutamyl-gamma-aminobutyrate hydrolase family protein [Acidobacteriota bacterium]
MIYLVDNTIDGQGLSPREIRDALERLCPGVPIVVERYTDVSLRRVRELSPSHIILSGQSHPWSIYTQESLAGVFEVIQEAAQPILGICGGHQQVAISYGSTLGIMNRVAPGEGYEGAVKLRGFYDVETNGEDIFANLPGRVTVWQSHYEEVKELPHEFEITGSSETCRIEAMRHRSRQLFT